MFKKRRKKSDINKSDRKVDETSLVLSLDAFFNIGSTEETNSEFAFDICVCRFCFVFGQIWSV